jgi:DNA-binding response OmpR family regulator
MSADETRRPIVLVVDDEPLIAQLVAETLAAEGYEVETASNGREALGKITLRSVDLVLCDLRMPELDGVGLYRGLEKRHPDLLRRIAFVTGTTESSDYARFLEETAVPVLHKPFNLEDLQRFVRQLL